MTEIINPVIPSNPNAPNSNAINAQPPNNWYGWAFRAPESSGRTHSFFQPTNTLGARQQAATSPSLLTADEIESGIAPAVVLPFEPEGSRLDVDIYTTSFGEGVNLDPGTEVEFELDLSVTTPEAGTIVDVSALGQKAAHCDLKPTSNKCVIRVSCLVDPKRQLNCVDGPIIIYNNDFGKRAIFRVTSKRILPPDEQKRIRSYAAGWVNEGDIDGYEFNDFLPDATPVILTSDGPVYLAGKHDMRWPRDKEFFEIVDLKPNDILKINSYTQSETASMVQVLIWDPNTNIAQVLKSAGYQDPSNCLPGQNLFDGCTPNEIIVKTPSNYNSDTMRFIVMMVQAGRSPAHRNEATTWDMVLQRKQEEQLKKQHLPLIMRGDL